MGRGGAVGEHDLELPDDPTSRWVLPVADKDGGGKRGSDAVFDRRRARLCQFLPQGWPAGGLYYSILSLRDDIRHFNVTPSKVQLIKDQLTELLTGYGEVDILITDGWDAPWSRITYEEVSFHE